MNKDYFDTTKDWQTKEKDMEMALQVLFDIWRSSKPKYQDYDKDKKISDALISEWAKKLLSTYSKHYSKKMHTDIYQNVIYAFAALYPKDGLPRKELAEFIENEKKTLFAG